VAYRSLQGEDFGFDQYFSFLIKTAMMAWAFGMFNGYFFFSWIRLANNRFAHASSMIQATLSLCACYSAFVLAEGVFGISGVLATVASSAVLSMHMWHHIVNREAMEIVWHTVETLGNILIFFLSGSLTGKIMLHTAPADFGRLVALYCFLLVLRAAFIFASIPLLKFLSTERQPVTIADAAVMTWGGLRGAVGLALAIQVFEEKAPDIVTGEKHVSDQQASRVFFFVGGIALLTTIINATTCPMLVNWLGITAVPAAKQRLLKMLAHRLFDFASEQKVPEEVVNHLKATHHEIEHEIDETGMRPPLLGQNPGSYQRVSMRIHGEQDAIKDDNPTVAQKLQDARKEFLGLPLEARKHVPIDDQGLQETNELTVVLRTQEMNIDMAKVVNRTFLSLVTKGYWKGIEDGSLLAGSSEAALLFTSAQLSQSPLRPDLIDFEIIDKDLKKESDDHGPKALSWWKLFPTHEEFKHFKCGRSHHELVQSNVFNLTLAIVILLNAVYLVIDTAYRTQENAGHAGWWIVDITFQLIFTVECMMKLMDMSWHYFTSPSNVFDFLLVILGFVGFALASESNREAAKASGEARSIRFVRIFRILRFLRVIRLYHAFASGRGRVSQELADHVRRMTILGSYIRAHVHAQRALVEFFGRSGRIDAQQQPELARCICQSQVSVYKAATRQAHERSGLDEGIRNQFDMELEEKAFTEHFETFITKAMDGGAVSAREAESLLHPLHHQLKLCLQRLQALNEGIVSE